MTTSQWRLHSRRVIESVFLEYEAQCACLFKPLNHEKLLKLVSDAYPFGQRTNLPYQQWLKEVKALKVFLLTKDPARAYYGWCERYFGSQRKLANRKPVEGQIGLFG
jgi:hypothetical protein